MSSEELPSSGNYANPDINTFLDLLHVSELLALKEKHFMNYKNSIALR